ncbi:MAG: hypothetical protein C4289_13460 [Chloroflexota bacterium]
MVGLGPGAVHVGELVEAAGIAPQAFGHVVVVIRVMVDAGAHDHGLIDAVLIHFEEKLLDDAPA